jgi:hypothetical protein
MDVLLLTARLGAPVSSSPRPSKEGLLRASQGQNLVFTVLYVPSLLDSGGQGGGGDHGLSFPAKFLKRLKLVPPRSASALTNKTGPGPLRPTVGSTECITAPFSVCVPIKF